MPDRRHAHPRRGGPRRPRRRHPVRRPHRPRPRPRLRHRRGRRPRAHQRPQPPRPHHRGDLRRRSLRAGPSRRRRPRRRPRRARGRHRRAPRRSRGPTSPPEPGDVVFAVGRTADGGARITHGMVSGVERSFRGPRGRRITGSLEHTAPLARGSSGSPVVDADGTAARRSTPPGWPTASTWRSPPTPSCGPASTPSCEASPCTDSCSAWAWPLPTSPASSARRSAWPTGKACSCAPSRPTARPSGPGIKTGDLITQAGRHRVTTVDDLHTALDAAREAQALTLHARPRRRRARRHRRLRRRRRREAAGERRG